MGNENSIGQPEDLNTMKKYQGFTIRHINMIKEKLDLLADEDLTIDKTSFQLAMKTKDGETDRIFQLFDLSNDGKIETLEFICALSLIAHASLREKCDTIFGLYDFDKNRTMTRNELIILIKTVLTSLNAMTSKGECTIQEAEAMADQILNRYDTNKDASISMKEFHSFVSKDPDILKMLFSYGLISQEDLRFNFGYSDLPEADSDLESEIKKSKIRIDERTERIKLGIEHTVDQDVQDLEDLLLQEDEEEAEGQEENEEEKMEDKSKFPWFKQIYPSKNYTLSKADANPPNASLEIDYVYGFRSFDTRNNLKYSYLNELVYHVGAMGITLDPAVHKQKFYMEHTDDITCLDVCENIAVTGQMGRIAQICVWDLTNLETRAVLKGILKVGVSNIAVSNDQKKVVAVGMDDDQCLAIYDIEKALFARLNGKKDESLIASSKGPRSEIFDIKFDRSDKTIVIACKGEVNFLTFENGHMRMQRGGWEPKICPLQSVLSIGLSDNSIVTGTFRGNLILWRGNRTTQAIEAHKGPVMAIHTRKSEIGVITGGKDGVINFWDGNLKLKQQIQLADLTDITIQNLKITALCENATGTNLVIGTRGGEIIEVVNEKARKVMNGHFYGQLKGLVCHPKEHVFYTVGEDSLLMRWSINSRKLEHSLKLEYQSKTMDITTDGRFLAVGCHNGNILIFDPSTLLQQMDFKDRDSEISCVRFSPNNEYLLAAYTQPYCEVFVYSTKQHFKKISICSGFIDNILSIDFTQSCQYVMCGLMSQTIAYFTLVDELQPKIIHKGEQILCDEDWFTWTCPFGWHVNGIWPQIAEGNDINAVDRSKEKCVLVTADDYSALKLFRFPCYQQNQSYNRYTGHTNHVSNVKFSYQDEYVISLGGNEKSIIQWKYFHEKELQNDYDKVYMEEKKQKQEKKEHDDIDDLIEENDQKKKVTRNSSNKPYLQQIKGMVSEQTYNNILPDQYLTLQYAVGCRVQYNDTKIFRILRYTFNGKIVFPTGSIVTIQDIKVDQKSQYRHQQFFTRHSQDVVSLAMHPKGNVVSTGTGVSQANKMVEIMIWEIESKQLLCVIQDFHLKGITAMEFSPDGTLLLTIGQDEDNSLGIYDWQANRLLCTSKIDKSGVNDIAWILNNKFVTCGNKHFKIWQQKGRNLKYEFGNFGGVYESQTAVVFGFGMEIVSGGQNGTLSLWKGNNVSQRYPYAHGGQINILLGIKQQLYSGGADGKIIIWNLNQNTLQQQQILVETEQICKSVTDILSMDMKNEQFVIVLGNGQMWECINANPIRTQLLLQWHHSGDLLGLGSQLENKKFITCGSDRIIRQWDYDKRCQVNSSSQFDYDLRAIDWLDEVVVVGDSRSIIYLMDASFNILDRKPSKFASMKTRTGGYMISDIKISPDKQKVAFGGQGGPSHIEIWDIGNNNKLTKQYIINVGFTSSLTHLDWDESSNYIVCTSDSYELKFLSYFKQKDCSVNIIKDIQWNTWSCNYGYYVQGIYPQSQGNDISAVQASHKKEFLLTADNNGILRLFKYPANYEPKQLHRQYHAHSGFVSSIKFLNNDQHCISIGQKDNTILFWNVEHDLNNNQLNNVNVDQQQEEEKKLQQLLNQIDIPQAQIKKLGNDKYGKQQTLNQDANDMFTGQDTNPQNSGEDSQDELYDQQTNFIFMKPWVANVKEPTNYYKDPINQNKPPRIDLQLEYAHGYRAHDTKNNIKYLKNGNILYHAASLGIVMDPLTNVQKFFNYHRDDIISMDLHHDGIRVATGEIGTNPLIFVWDSNTLQPLCLFNALSTGVSSLHFSHDKLLALAIDPQHTIAVFEINTKSKTGGSLLFKEKIGLDIAIEAKWRNETEFITIGINHFKVWTLTSISLISRSIPLPPDINTVFLTCAFAYDELYISDLEGNIQIWKNFQYQYSATNHDFVPAEALYFGKDYAVTAGRDQKINIIELKQTFKSIPLIQFKLNEVIKNITQPEIKSIQLSSDTKTLLVGTKGGDIFEISTKDNKINQTTRYSIPKILVKSHYNPSKNGEIWGLAFNPAEPDIYYTCGDDATLRGWSLSQKKMLFTIRTNLDTNQNEIKPDEHGNFVDSVKGRCIAVSPDGQYVTVGFKDGSLRVFDKDNKQKQIVKVGKNWLSDLKFSPDGTKLVMGSHDNSIYIYTFPELKLHHKPLRKHSEFIRNIDFSCDGKKIHSTCGGYDLLFWDIENPKQLPHGPLLLRDEKWQTWTSTLGWPVQGIWNQESDGSDINCVDRSHGIYSNEDKAPDNYHFLAVGNDFNEVKIYRYPCVQRGALAVVGRGHSSPISCVKFSADDQYLISIGGEDMTILQWKIIKS